MPNIRTDHHLAISLRKQGKSYNEIWRELGIPKSTLSDWFKDNDWSKTIKSKLIQRAQVLANPKLKLMHRANKTKWDKWHEECREKAVLEFPQHSQGPLFIAGLMLYWSEGDKVIKNSQVRLINTDPEMIKVFNKFLTETLAINPKKIVFKLTLYPDLDDLFLRKLWSKMLKVPLTQFRKSVFIQSKHPTKILSYGICSIEVYSRELKEKMFKWIELYQSVFDKN